MYHAGGDTDGGGCACAGAGGIWEIIVLSAQYYYEPTTTLKE